VHALQSPGQVAQLSVPLHALSPQKGPQALHLVVAMSLHAAFHAVVQQAASMAQTHSSTASSMQPGVAPAVQQSPLQVLHESAAAAQVASHPAVQQAGLVLHTQLWTVASMQPTCACGVQHEPLQAPQSAAQVTQFSGASQSESPQTGAHAEQLALAVATHDAFQMPEPGAQQLTFAAHTQASMVSSSQPGLL